MQTAAVYVLTGTSLLVAAAVLALGIWVAVRERWQAVGMQFAALAFLVAVWLACAGLVVASDDVATAVAWARASYLGVALIPAAIYHFAARLLGRHREQQRAIALLWAAGFVLAAVAQ